MKLYLGAYSLGKIIFYLILNVLVPVVLLAAGVVRLLKGRKEGKLKIVPACMSAAGGIWLAWDIYSLANFTRKAAMSVSIIGGADGPTSIFLAGRVGNKPHWGILLLGAAVALGAVWIYKKTRKK